MTCSASLSILTRTPVTVEVSADAARPCTAQFSIARTLGKASNRRRTWPSSTGRDASNPTRSLGAGFSTMPCPNHATSLARSPTTPPAATTSSVQPGKNASITLRPRASRPWAWSPCGTPLRDTSATGNSSRSSSVTVSKSSASARAANRPPMLAPITMAWSPIRFIKCSLENALLPCPALGSAGTGRGHNRFFRRALSAITNTSREILKPNGPSCA